MYRYKFHLFFCYKRNNILPLRKSYSGNPSWFFDAIWNCFSQFLFARIWYSILLCHRDPCDDIVFSIEFPPLLSAPVTLLPLIPGRLLLLCSLFSTSLFFTDLWTPFSGYILNQITIPFSLTIYMDPVFQKVAKNRKNAPEFFGSTILTLSKNQIFCWSFHDSYIYIWSNNVI